MMDTNQFQPLETLLRKLMAQAEDGVALWDVSNQQFIYVNESLEKLIGVSRMALYHSPQSFWVSGDRVNLNF